VDKRLLIFDALNQFLRGYIVDPSLSSNGDPIGGFKGFLKILQKIARETKPDQIIVVWDGPHGSRRRKQKNSNYKEGRSPIRLNRSIQTLSPDQELQNKAWQQIQLINYLNETPIIQFMEGGIEADDVIAHIARHNNYKDWSKIIVSSDKDYIQLCDDKTVLYRPIQKEVLNKNRIIEQYGIHPNNFALARSITGDKSDNLEGVGGAGLKTIAKRFSFLAEEKSYTINEIVEKCEEEETKLKIHQNILDKASVLRDNYSLMQLYAPSIPATTTKRINYVLDNAEFTLNLTEFRAMMIKDGFGELNLETLFTIFKKIVNDSSK